MNNVIAFSNKTYPIKLILIGNVWTFVTQRIYSTEQLIIQ